MNFRLAEKMIETRFQLRDRENPDEIVDFLPNPAQHRLFGLCQKLHDEKRRLRIISVKSRRVGFSRAIEAIGCCFMFAYANFEGRVMAHFDETAMDILSSAGLMVYGDGSPGKGLPHRGVRQVWEPDTEYKSIVLPHGGRGRGSRASRLLRASAKVRGKGRGMGFSFYHGSEAAYYPVDSPFTAVLPALAKSPERSFAALESTGNGMVGDGEAFYKYWQQASDPDKLGDSEWVRFFVPWTEDPYAVSNQVPHDIPKDDEEKILLRAGLSKQQIAWRRIEIATTYQGIVEDFIVECPLTPTDAFRAGGFPAFAHEEQEYVTKTVREPRLTAELELTRDPWVVKLAPMGTRGRIKIWELPQPRFEYYIGVDCLPDGELVLTAERGFVPIETVRLSEHLIDEKRQATEIVNLQRREYEGDIISFWPYGATRPTRMTPEHPILVTSELGNRRVSRADRRFAHRNRPEWKHAREVTEDDVLVIPKRGTTLTDGELLAQFPERETIRALQNINPFTILEKDFWFLLGVYLADGWSSSHPIKLGNSYEIAIALNALKERELADTLTLIVQRLFQRQVHRRERGNCIELKFNSRTMFRFLDQFGHSAEKKHLPEWVQGLPDHLATALIGGYLEGDGCTTGDGHFLVSVSEHLLMGFQRLMLRQGAYASICLLREAGVHTFPSGKVSPTKRAWQMRIGPQDWQILIGRDEATRAQYRWFDDENIYLRIRKIDRTPFKGTVNNFETATHTYLGNMITIHNCARGPDMKRDDARPGDFAAITVFNGSTGEQAASFCERVDPSKIADIVNKMGRFWRTPQIAPNHCALLNIEVNANLGAECQRVLRDRYAYPVWRFYRWRGGKDDRYNRKSSTAIGWETTGASRKLMFAMFRNALRERKVAVRDSEFASQICSATMDDGRWEITHGHDDLMVSGLLAWAAVIQYPPQIIAPRRDIAEDAHPLAEFDDAMFPLVEQLARTESKEMEQLLAPRRKQTRDPLQGVLTEPTLG